MKKKTFTGHIIPPNDQRYLPTNFNLQKHLFFFCQNLHNQINHFYQQINWTDYMQKMKCERVLTDFDLATRYVQRKKLIRKRQIYLDTF